MRDRSILIQPLAVSNFNLTPRLFRHYTVNMSKSAPGKYYRQGMSLKTLFRKFPNNDTAERWFVKTRWPHGVAYHYCGSLNVKVGCQHKTMPFRCREKACAKRFSVRTGTVMPVVKARLSGLGHRYLPVVHEH